MTRRCCVVSAVVHVLVLFILLPSSGRITLKVIEQIAHVMLDRSQTENSTSGNMFIFCVTVSLTYQRSLVKSCGDDVIFYWNSTLSISFVRWGIKNPQIESLSMLFMYVDAVRVVVISDANSGYNGRVSFVGNLTAGHVWFKLSNLTIKDTNYYAVYIIAGGGHEQFLSTFLRVQGKI